MTGRKCTPRDDLLMKIHPWQTISPPSSSRLSKTSRPFHGQRLNWCGKFERFSFFTVLFWKAFSVICVNITWVISFIFWSVNGETTLGSPWLPCCYHSQKYAIILWCASSRLCKVAFEVQGKLWNCIRFGSSKPSQRISFKVCCFIARGLALTIFSPSNYIQGL